MTTIDKCDKVCFNSQTKNMNRKIQSMKRGFTLIELLVVMGILAVLLAAVLIAINPQRQFAQSRDSQRRNDILAILNAVQQNIADNKGSFSGASIPSTSTVIKKTGGVDLCSAITPLYVSLLPTDPNNTTFVDCTAYDTGYSISKDANGRITVSAVPEIAASISVTR